MATGTLVDCDFGWPGWILIAFGVLFFVAAMQDGGDDDNPHGDSTLYGP
jgi:hypothetical protein